MLVSFDPRNRHIDEILDIIEKLETYLKGNV